METRAAADALLVKNWRRSTLLNMISFVILIYDLTEKITDDDCNICVRKS